MKLFVLMCVVVLMLPCAGFPQAPERTGYYINLNGLEENVVYDIFDMTLNLTYTDRYGEWDDLLLKIYDGKRQAVASLKMDKVLGLNSYAIRLDEVYAGWEWDQTYTAEVKDERNRQFCVPIRLRRPLEEIAPMASIIVNPVQISCEGPEPSLIEFFGSIEGGRPPFTVQWYVLNRTRSDLLYQPREEIVASRGRVPQIVVDKNPEYFVVLYVKDACGQEDKQIANIVCGDGMKQINTVFLEELASPVFKNRGSVQQTQ